MAKKFHTFRMSLPFYHYIRHAVKHNLQDDNVPTIHFTCQIDFSFQEKEP